MNNSRSSLYKPQSSLEDLLDISGRDFQGILTTVRTVRALKLLAKANKASSEKIVQVGDEILIPNNPV